jgi:hypothetical protein
MYCVFKYVDGDMLLYDIDFPSQEEAEKFASRIHRKYGYVTLVCDPNGKKIVGYGDETVLKDR